MSDEAQKWLKMAEMDWRAASLLIGGDTNVAVCFHCQQCIEKLMKGCLIACSTRPPHIHDLEILSGMLASVLPEWSADAVELRLLTRGAVETRYVDEIDDKETQQSVDIARRLRSKLLQLISTTSLGNDSGDPQM